MSISIKRKKIFQKGKTPFFCILKGLSNKHKLFFRHILFIDRRRLISITAPGRFRDNNLFFSGEEIHKEEDMPISRRAFDEQFKHP